MINRCSELYARFLVAAAGAMLFLFTVVVSYQVISRYIDFVPRYFWTEEVSRFSFIWMTFLGAAAAVWYKTHFDIDIVPTAISDRFGRQIDFVAQLVIAMVGLTMLIGGIHFFVMGLSRVSTTSGIRLSWIYLAIPISGLSIMLFSVARLLNARISGGASTDT